MADLTLSADETKFFIDLLERFPCLWNMASAEYKVKNCKLRARMEIAEIIGKFDFGLFRKI
jgi:hypothetical protein